MLANPYEIPGSVESARISVFMSGPVFREFSALPQQEYDPDDPSTLPKRSTMDSLARTIASLMARGAEVYRDGSGWRVDGALPSNSLSTLQELGRQERWHSTSVQYRPSDVITLESAALVSWNCGTPLVPETTQRAPWPLYGYSGTRRARAIAIIRNEITVDAPIPGLLNVSGTLVTPTERPTTGVLVMLPFYSVQPALQVDSAGTPVGLSISDRLGQSLGLMDSDGRPIKHELTTGNVKPFGPAVVRCRIDQVPAGDPDRNFNVVVELLRNDREVGSIDFQIAYDESVMAPGFYNHLDPEPVSAQPPTFVDFDFDDVFPADAAGMTNCAAFSFALAEQGRLTLDIVDEQEGDTHWRIERDGLAVAEDDGTEADVELDAGSYRLFVFSDAADVSRHAVDSLVVVANGFVDASSGRETYSRDILRVRFAGWEPAGQAGYVETPSGQESFDYSGNFEIVAQLIPVTKSVRYANPQEGETPSVPPYDPPFDGYEDIELLPPYPFDKYAEAITAWRWFMTYLPATARPSFIANWEGELDRGVALGLHRFYYDSAPRRLVIRRDSGELTHINLPGRDYSWKELAGKTRANRSTVVRMTGGSLQSQTVAGSVVALSSDPFAVVTVVSVLSDDVMVVSEPVGDGTEQSVIRGVRGETDAASTTIISGTDTNFLTDTLTGDVVFLSSDSGTFATIIDITSPPDIIVPAASDYVLQLDRPLGNGDFQGIAVGSGLVKCETTGSDPYAYPSTRLSAIRPGDKVLVLYESGRAGLVVKLAENSVWGPGDETATRQYGEVVAVRSAQAPDDVREANFTIRWRNVYQENVEVIAWRLIDSSGGAMTATIDPGKLKLPANSPGSEMSVVLRWRRGAYTPEMRAEQWPRLIFYTNVGASETLVLRPSYLEDL